VSAHTDYLRHLAWALPFLVGQWLANPRKLWQARWVVLATSLGAGLWLSLADALAIAQGIWAFDDAHLLGLRCLGVPVEEMIFFTVTAQLVAQSLVLFHRRANG
jgi:lycopene cyclase domain-containing protein